MVHYFPSALLNSLTQKFVSSMGAFCDVGYEVSGRIDALCNTVVESKYKVGDRVIVYPEQEHSQEDGYVFLQF